jgi:hypothetical protein
MTRKKGGLFVRAQVASQDILAEVAEGNAEVGR